MTVHKEEEAERGKTMSRRKLLASLGAATALGVTSVAVASPGGGSVASLMSGGDAAVCVQTLEELLALGSGEHCVVWADPQRGGIFVHDSAAVPDHATAALCGLRFPASGGGCWVRQFGGAISVSWFGAAGDGTTDDWPAFDSAIARLGKGDVLLVPEGVYAVSRTVVVNKGFVTISGQGKLLAKAPFTGDFLVGIQREGGTDYYHWPCHIDGLWLDCAFLCRGLDCYHLDHIEHRNVRVENSYGYAARYDRIRESNSWGFKAINCQSREAFPTPADWSGASAYAVGNRARRQPAPYAPTTVYSVSDKVLAGDGRNYASMAAGNSGNDPVSSPDHWALVPAEDYECLIAHTNRDPLTYHTNNGTAGNRFWKRIYQDEALLEIVDSVQQTGDRTNQFNFFGPVLRDCGNKCYIRIDCNRGSTFATHVNVHGGHIHYLGGTTPGTTYPNVVVESNVRMVEIGRCQNINFYGSNIRMWDSPDAIGILIGNGGGKGPSKIRFVNCPISGDAARQRGVIVMGNGGSGQSQLLSGVYLTGANTTPIADKGRFFRFDLQSEMRVSMPKGAASAPKAFEAVIDSGYGDARPFEASLTGDQASRIMLQISSGVSRLRLGNGTVSDVELRRGGTDLLELAAGDSFKVDGAWNAGMLKLGAYCLWVDSEGRLRIKNGAPASELDGIAVGAQE
ncbi:MAG: hypothetical protein K0Q94_6262 [Paenibacillus sp.]|jgi:hypothetical protein|nr:hypothetical protein [Paenibacillus sp.]